jgi:hypothetical protein
MIQTTRAISLVLVSSASVLGGYHAMKPATPQYADQDEWGDPSTRPAGSHYYGSSGNHSYYYYHHHYYGSSGFSSGSSFSSRSSFGTSHGGFGSTGHSAHG